MSRYSPFSDLKSSTKQDEFLYVQKKLVKNVEGGEKLIFGGVGGVQIYLNCAVGMIRV